MKEIALFWVCMYGLVMPYLSELHIWLFGRTSTYYFSGAAISSGGLGGMVLYEFASCVRGHTSFIRFFM